jgi:TonB family protein
MLLPFLAALGTAAAQSPAPPPVDPRLATYEEAVTAITAAVRGAHRRLAVCPTPGGSRIVLKVDLRGSGTVTTASVGTTGSSRVSAPCLEEVVRSVFAAAPPPVGREAAVVLDAATLSLDGDVALLGELPADSVETGVRTRIDAIAQCYVSALAARPGLEGKVVVAFTVLPDGKVAAAEVRQSELKDTTAEVCVLGQLMGATFRPPDGGAIVRVTYPFTFNPP